MAICLMPLQELNGHTSTSRREYIPNDGAIRYLDILCFKILVPISPKILAEIPVHKASHSPKPSQLI